MQTAPATPDEDLRLGFLHALQLLDSPPEEAFDRITRLAAAQLGTPIALVSLIDAKRQWFKSRFGLDAAETPRDWAFCGHAIHGRGPFVVPDASADPRFADNPMVTGEPNIRFYAGVPVTTADGMALGTLCVVDSTPRLPSAAQLAVLSDLAALVSREIAHRETARRASGVSQNLEEALTRSEGAFRAAFEQAAVGIATVSLTGGWLRVNEKMASIVGYELAELRTLTFQQITHPEDLAGDLAKLDQLMRGETPDYNIEKRYIRRDGSMVWIRLTVSMVRNADGSPAYFISVVEDIDARKRAEAALLALHGELEERVRLRTQELAAVLEFAHDAYVAMDGDGTIREWNRRAEQLFGWQRAEMLGRRIEQTLIPAASLDAYRAAVAPHVHPDHHRAADQRLELQAACRNGRSLPVEMSLHTLPAGLGTRYCAFVRDISERRALQASLERQARQDALTGLPNRRELLERLPLALARSDRAGRALALLFIDLDRFKEVNDRLGHAAGDELLCRFAQRLVKLVRRTDTVARLAGDEFIVVAEGLDTQADDLAQLTSTIETEAARPFLLQGVEVTVGASVGCALYAPHCGHSAESLLDEADGAMYGHKARKGRRARGTAATGYANL